MIAMIRVKVLSHELSRGPVVARLVAPFVVRGIGNPEIKAKSLRLTSDSL